LLGKSSDFIAPIAIGDGSPLETILAPFRRGDYVCCDQSSSSHFRRRRRTMDKRFQGTVDFLDVVRFGIVMFTEAQRVEHKGGDALVRLFKRAEPMLARHRR
jgi:hypothetical protein